MFKKTYKVNWLARSWVVKFYYDGGYTLWAENVEKKKKKKEKQSEKEIVYITNCPPMKSILLAEFCERNHNTLQMN